MHPQGSFMVLTKALRHRVGNRRALKAYVESEAFMALFGNLLPQRRMTVLAIVAEAKAACGAPPAPRAVPKANWSDLAFRARFCAAYARGLSDEEVARHCRITLGAAIRAKHRYVLAPKAPLAMAA